MHFILTGQEICRICLNFTVLAQLACTNEQMVDGLLTNQSERFTFVMLYKIIKEVNIKNGY